IAARDGAATFFPPNGGAVSGAEEGRRALPLRCEIVCLRRIQPAAGSAVGGLRVGRLLERLPGGDRAPEWQGGADEAACHGGVSLGGRRVETRSSARRSGLTRVS